MSRRHFGVGRVMHFIVLIALACGLTAQTAAQTAQPAATQQTMTRSSPASDEKAPLPGERALVDPVTGQLIGSTAAHPHGGQGPQPSDPGRIMPKSDATGPGPGLEIGMPTPVKFYGNVGPGGTLPGQDAPSAPGGPVRVMDAATERLGPGGTVAQTPTSQPLTPGAATPSQPARQDGQQQPAKKPGLSNDGGPVRNKPAAQGGLQVVIDPQTGRVVEPTEAQLLELEQQHQQAVELGEPLEVVERAGLVSGMMADVPLWLYPLVTATMGPDGQVTIQESQAQGEAAAALKRGPGGEQLVQSEAAQHLDPAGALQLNLPPPADVTVTIVNLDGAGEGFNDPTAVAPVFGNPGTTLGAQRLNAFRAAAEYWGGILKSTVPIRVDARMNPQPCTATSAVLGSAAPTTVHRDFTGAPVAATWYVQAVANSRAGVDQDATQSDISATFNSDVDNPTCLGATSWWYGIGAPAPAGTIDFYTVVQHEIGHGIGVLSLVSLSTGAKFAGFDDAYERWLWDWNIGGWPAMSNAQRLASSVNTGQVIFWGPRATEAARGLLSAGLNLGYPRIYAPNPVQGGSSISHWDTVVTPNELMEPAITPPPGPYVYLTGGLLEDVGWQLLSNGVFDYGGLGTWTWNPTNGFAQPTAANPSLLEPWNGNFVGIYPGSGTWLWNGTTASWTQLTAAIPDQVKACGNNLLWAGAAFGTWRWNTTTGWAQLTTANPQSMQCFGGNMAWEAASGTWIFNFSTGVWSQITGANPAAMQPCGSRLVWWGPGFGTWYYTTAGWTQITTEVPQSTVCYRGKVAWEAVIGTWLYDFSTGWSLITSNNPDQILAWGPTLVWESPLGTWTYDQLGAWTQITAANPILIEVLGAQLLWSDNTGTWVWSGGGGGAGWTFLTSAAPTQIVSTGAVQ